MMVYFRGFVFEKSSVKVVMEPKVYRNKDKALVARVNIWINGVEEPFSHTCELQTAEYGERIVDKSFLGFKYKRKQPALVTYSKEVYSQFEEYVNLMEDFNNFLRDIDA